MSLSDIYYNPKTGYTGVQELMRRTGKGKKEVEEFLQAQDVYTLHKPLKTKFQRRRVYVDGIDDQWQADLVDMQKFRLQNKEKGGAVNYILTVIDIFLSMHGVFQLKRKREMK